MRSEMKSASGGKICVTSQGNNLDAQVDPRFGRCLYFIIADPETMQFEAVENPGVGAMGGAGIQSAQLIANKGVEVVLTGNVGPNASQTLGAAGVKVVTGVSGQVKEVIERYKKGEFTPSNGPTVPGHFGMSMPGGGGGIGMRRPMGRATGWQQPATQPPQVSKEQELELLKQQAQTLKKQMEEIEKKINELSKK